MADFTKLVAINFTTNASVAMKQIEALRIAINKISKEAIELRIKKGESLSVIQKSLISDFEKSMKPLKSDFMKFDINGKPLINLTTGKPVLDTAAYSAAMTKYKELLGSYKSTLSETISEIRKADSANRQFVSSFSSKSLTEQKKELEKINLELRNFISNTGTSVLDKGQLRAVENKLVSEYGKERIKPKVDPVTNELVPVDMNEATNDIRAFRQIIKTELSKIVADYKTSQKEIEKILADSNKIKLTGTKSLTEEEIKLLKYKTGVMVEEARRQRESERQGLTGNALIAKAKEQADAAKAAYKSASDEYEKQVQQNIALSKQAEIQGDTFTASELENGKKRANALDIERRAMKQNADNTVNELKKISNASKEVSNTSGGFSKLGTVLKYVFGSILGLSAVSALRSMVNFLSQAGEKALSLSKAMFTLNIAVRNMQRQGNPTSLGQLRDEMAQFSKEFDFFSELEVSRAFAEATNKLANLGYTTEQVANVVRAGMIVYITDLTGRFNDLGEAINGVTNYLASGYGESLERSGFIAGRAGDKMLAFEKGLGQSLATLDPLTLSQERYNLLLLQTAEKTKDAEAFTKTLAGAYKQAQADIVDATVNIGMATDDLVVLWERNKAIILKSIAESAPVKATIVQGEINQQVDLLAVKYVEVQDEVKELIRLRKIAEERGTGENRLKFYDDQIKALQDLSMQLMKTTAEFILFETVTGEEVFDTERIDEFLRKTKELGASSADVNFRLQPIFKTQENTLDLEGWKDWFEDEVKEKIRDVVEIPVTPKPLFTPEMAKINDAYQQMITGLTEITQEETKRLAELWNDYVQDVGGYLQELDGTTVEIEANFVIGKLRTDLSQNLNDLLDDYLEKLPAIEADYQKKLAEAQKDYATQVAQAQRDFNIRRAQAERNYRLRELQAEREFQEDLRKLREGYLLDLEDALRERDALQVIRLAREYSLQKDQATRQYELDKQARKEAYEEEKKQAAIEQAERMRQLYEELQARLAAIAIEKEEERRIAKEEYDKAYAEEVERYEQARTERDTRLANDQKELEKETDAKITAFLDRLRAEGVLTESFLSDFSTKLKEKIGPGSEYERIMEFFEQTALQKSLNVGNAFATLMARIAALSALGGAIDGAIAKLPQTPITTTPQKKYSGGTVIATKPTTVTFGEYEPEFVEFTPLSKLSKSKAMDIANNPLSSEESRLMALSSIGSGRTGSFSSGGKKKNEYAFSNLRGQGTSVPTSYGDGRNSMNKFIFEMLLSPDLEARIVSYTLGETADVIMNVLREQR